MLSKKSNGIRKFTIGGSVILQWYFNHPVILSGVFRLDPMIKDWEKIHLCFPGLDIVPGQYAKFSKITQILKYWCCRHNTPTYRHTDTYIDNMITRSEKIRLKYELKQKQICQKLSSKRDVFCVCHNKYYCIVIINAG